MTTRITASARPSDVRRQNRRAVLDVLRLQGPQSRSSLGAVTSLSAQALAGIMPGLIEDGLAVEINDRATGVRRGRPATYYEAAPTAATAVGVYIGRRNLVVIAADALGREIERRSVTTPTKDADATLRLVVDLTRPLLARAGAPRAHVAVVLHGDIDPATGTCLHSSPLHWHDVPVAPPIEAELGVPVSVVHVAHAVALAEQREGLAHGLSDVVALHLGSVPSAGVLIDGKLHRGRNGRAGIVRDCLVAMGDGPTERTLESVVSGEALVERFTATKPTGHRANWPADIAHAAAAGDPVARSILTEAAEAVVLAADWLIACFAPEKLILTGGLVDQPGDHTAQLVSRVRSSLERRGRTGVTVDASRLGGLGAIRGGVIIAADACQEGIG